MTAKLTSADVTQCQCEVTTTPGFMQLGGVKTTERCKNRPTAILHEAEAGPDGQKGSMSVCNSCLTEFEKKVTQGKAPKYDAKPIQFCPQCGKKEVAYPGAVYCGAGCCARAEAHETPTGG